ncbi:MAG TPA: GxxExxY protein [Marinilabiliales bacterium]|jgi:GxxExxY protein|nr:MAG: GxxExxY protein [Bacteroidetes bacterium GWA2_40_14]OFX58496.1 MAG: GxxExxY protein [Bacteroidetes bacterium GWC2_40_13]OFX74118.1 MAG: GxxExxY protein [Bacteroidetes bacterium GWD2_40_43]OFX93048.1 MAG: GxxExxY protein [Bacteroidetes bacterium GWE2_40_63]OFY21418.1 MAG: GxxExxY protein [Bacteroidetes bacterium GWF2_40_13]OFZ27412.1 MAG: GxxExxY protein [Bacteroidetes bacterium RIFOXYC2_FULL_40_12]HAM98196.1 GxxExxY protein [Marinilabiliales bacterium]
MITEEYNRLSGIILHSSIEVHKEMGPGLLESVYEICLEEELIRRGIKCQRQVIIPLCYKGKELSKDFRIDILVENEIIIEVKAVEYILNVHEAQIISYLKISNKKLGFLINFNEALVKEGFHRFVNGF